MSTSQSDVYAVIDKSKKTSEQPSEQETSEQPSEQPSEQEPSEQSPEVPNRDPGLLDDENTYEDVSPQRNEPNTNGTVGSPPRTAEYADPIDAIHALPQPRTTEYAEPIDVEPRRNVKPPKPARTPPQKRNEGYEDVEPRRNVKPPPKPPRTPPQKRNVEYEDVQLYHELEDPNAPRRSPPPNVSPPPPPRSAQNEEYEDVEPQRNVTPPQKRNEGSERSPRSARSPPPNVSPPPPPRSAQNEGYEDVEPRRNVKPPPKPARTPPQKRNVGSEPPNGHYAFVGENYEAPPPEEPLYHVLETPPPNVPPPPPPGSAPSEEPSALIELCDLLSYAINIPLILGLIFFHILLYQQGEKIMPVEILIPSIVFEVLYLCLTVGSDNVNVFLKRQFIKNNFSRNIHTIAMIIHIAICTLYWVFGNFKQPEIDIKISVTVLSGVSIVTNLADTIVALFLGRKK